MTDDDAMLGKKVCWEFLKDLGYPCNFDENKSDSYREISPTFCLWRESALENEKQ